MLTIGEFSNICKVSTKTLRYYAKIGLLLPNKINPENGYRYYSIDQLETMLFIERLKSYNFSLEEIKVILNLGKLQNEKLYAALARKKKEVKEQIDKSNIILERLNEDMLCLQQGRSIMSYLENFDIELVEVSKMNLISVHKRVHENEFVEAYSTCFGELFKQIQIDNLNIIASPMVLFHDAEFSVLGLDTEFAIPVKEKTIATKEFCPGLCLKTVLQGSYSNLPSIYAKHRKWIEEQGYMYRDALFEVYITDPSCVSKESELITEIYSPIKKVQ
ncbi:MerR family transcriptional regulator [Thomasclavelia saccharogumia]|uniref:MerR family transcriptional regulator n=1 Tax=Thomasclavelia saccharogumia TaxID=341225 RepID=UPI00047B2819|nr:MerR family transcriptional regulator [Thomasclavelia saccharogumia]